jgi:hypothetical protein
MSVAGSHQHAAIRLPLAEEVVAMAIDYSERYVAEQYRSASTLVVRAAIRLFPVIEFVRALQRRVARTSIEAAPLVPCRISDALERAAPHFQKHGWAFIEEIFDAGFHRFLVAHWPKRRYFTAPFDVHKSYDKGFRWVDRSTARDDRWASVLAADARKTADDGYPAYLDRHPHIRHLIDSLRSPETLARMQAFSGRSEPLLLNRFQLTATYPGTLVAPHRDSPQQGRNWLQFLFYVKATGGARSGGTAIIRDNTFRDVIFESARLTNTCLVFDPHAPFFHGVRPIAFCKFRWVVGAEYISPLADGPDS